MMHELKQQDTRFTISRRALVQGAAASLGVALTGCEPPAKKVAETPLGIVRGYEDQGYRLYGVIPTTDSYIGSDVLTKVRPQPIFVEWFSQGPELPYKEPAFRYVIWATRDEADHVLETSWVKSVIEKGPEHVTEVGASQSANGQLAVRFFPNANLGVPLDSSYAAASQIIQAWRDATQDVEGVAINPGPEPVIPKSDHVSEIVEREQAIIHFSTPMLDPKVLDVVKNHPQTMSIRWGGPFMTLYCPPCGLG